MGTVNTGVGSAIMAVRSKHALAGMYVIILRRDDTDEIVSSNVEDIPRNPRLTAICRRVLWEIGVNDPQSCEFIVMLYCLPSGGVQIVLDQATLRKYVHLNYGG